MDDKSVRDNICDIALELGVRLKSVYRNPLTNRWYIHEHAPSGIDYIEFVPVQTPEDFADQVRGLLDPSSVVKTLENVIEELRSRDRDVIYGAMQRLASFGESAVEPLLAILINSNVRRQVRSHCASTLAMIGSTRAVPVLVRVLGDSDPNMRWTAIRALGEIGDATALPELQRLAETDEETFLLFPGKTIDNRSAARDSIERIKARKSAPPAI
jgi:hypothetical protein